MSALSEKMADTPFRFIVHRGVKISSRYGKNHEIKKMVVVVDRLLASLPGALASIWCDSKACATYTAHAGPMIGHSAFLAEAVASALDKFFRQTDGGHNGIVFHWAGEEIWVDPWWDEEGAS